MASPTLKTFTGQANPGEATPATPSARAFTAQMLDDDAPPAITPILRVFDSQAINNDPAPPVSPRLRVFSAAFDEGPPPPDYLPPADPIFGNIEGTQVNGNEKGRTQVTLNFSTVTTSQVTPGEYLGDATGGEQQLAVLYPSIKEPV